MTNLFLFIIIYIGFVQSVKKGSYLGCYKYSGNQNISHITSVEDCISYCDKNRYQFAVFSNSNATCFCSNFLGKIENSSSTVKCNDDSVYYSKNSVLDPPKNFSIVSLTEEGVQISWKKPENAIEVAGYEIIANNLHTFAQYPLQNLTWVFPNNTYQTFLNLQAASKYNIIIYAKSFDDAETHSASLTVETPVGVPDNIPAPPQILSRNGTKMIVKIHPVVNNNGPISYYQLIVLSEATKRYFQPKNLKNYQESLDNHLDYYIAAELTPYDIKENFVIGDEKYYRNYFNAPLLSSIDYILITGIVSDLNGLTKAAYSNYSTTISRKIESSVNPVDTPVTITLLTIAVVLFSILLIVSIIIFIILNNRVMRQHRHNRLSEQELTLQGPIISVENSCYIPDEEHCPINHYKNLKEHIKIFRLEDDLFVDSYSIIGKGKFGIICKAFLNENNDSISVAAYTIPDKSLLPEQKKLMLKDLDMLIKCGKHDNLVEFIGTSESSEMLYVLFKLFPMNLKQFLLDNRILLPNKFCKISESQILRIITQITHGLLELEKNNVIHTHLCSRNIMLTNDLVPKIFGFGLTDYVTERELDYTRWTAVEALHSENFNSKSPLWSFGILLWEICALGATPYNNILNNQVLINKISTGIRLPQLKYFNDHVYNIMLDCWQIDMDERPNCETLCHLIDKLQEDILVPFLSFNFYQTFEFEQYKPELEYKS